MRVYKIEIESEGHQYLLFDGEETDSLAVKLMHDAECFGSPKAEGWKSPPMYLDYPQLPRPDFLFVNLLLTFALNPVFSTPDARDEITWLLTKCGELLPLGGDATGFLAFNCTECIPALSNETTWDEESGEVEHYEFLQHRIDGEATVICAPELPLDLFAVAIDDDPHLEFKACVEANNLTGLRFDLVWDSESH